MKICPKCGNRLYKFKGIDKVKWWVCIYPGRIQYNLSRCNYWAHRDDGFINTIISFIGLCIVLFILVIILRSC